MTDHSKGLDLPIAVLKILTWLMRYPSQRNLRNTIRLCRIVSNASFHSWRIITLNPFHDRGYCRRHEIQIAMESMVN